MGSVEIITNLKELEDLGGAEGEMAFCKEDRGLYLSDGEQWWLLSYAQPANGLGRAIKMAEE